MPKLEKIVTLEAQRLHDAKILVGARKLKYLFGEIDSDGLNAGNSGRKLP